MVSSGSNTSDLQMDRSTPTSLELTTSNLQNISGRRGVGSEPKRIRAYDMNGRQLCAAGVGEGLDFGTLPSTWTVHTTLDTRHWVEILQQPGPDGRRYRLIDFVPRVVVFPDAFVPYLNNTIGCRGNNQISLLDTVISQPPYDKPREDGSDVETPSTPPTPD